MNTIAEFNGGSHEVQAAPELQPIALRSMFWRPNWLEPSDWMEHIPFAFWLVEAHRPKVIVELGTHYGTSYFAFCQAVERLGLDARCFAIDTWKGDEHAGFYGEEVFEKASVHNDAQYSGFSRLVRSSFDAARQHFTAGSIDLLHIDGQHTLEAVTKDFESWMPKLSERAVVVLHDTNVRERGFGVYQLFEQLKSRFPSFEFVHGQGLGVLGVGEHQNQMMQQLFSASQREDAQWSIRDVFARLGRSCADTYSAGRQTAMVRALTADMDQHKKQLEQISQALERTKAELDSQARELARSREKLFLQVEEHALERGQLAERVSMLQEVRVDLKEQLGRVQAQLERAHESIYREAPAGKIPGPGEWLEEHDPASPTRQSAELQAQLALLAQELAEQKAAHAAQSSTLRVELVQARNEAATANGAQDAALEAAATERQAQADAIAREHRIAIEALSSQLSASTGLISELREKHRVELEAAIEGKRRAESSVQTRFAETAQLTKKLIDLQQQLAEQSRTHQQLAADMESKILTMQAELEEARSRSRQFEERLSSIQRSRLWKLTAPLRALRSGSTEKPLAAAMPADLATEQERASAQVIRNSGLFDAAWYLKKNKDVADSGTEPVAHYLRNGARELRDPGPGFSTRAYLAAYPDVGEVGINPLVHYLQYGRAEGRVVEKAS